MHLKSLTLSGFKSFAKSTAFEFSTPVTAIVGPNGSGKSNVAEAIRWVLGEQSMKSLRGKKGEDLIYNGSDKTSRMGRAEVKLIFDNSKKQFPFEFDDVIIARRVMRDGTNQYLLNGSTVRLKDIFGMLAGVGLGSTQHHIISQGEVDRILWATPSDRQEMVEEALGLKEYHLKKRDADRKLHETRNNVKQVEAQRREIQPHLKYLAMQTEKMRAHENYRNELDEKITEYVTRENATLAELDRRSTEQKGPLEEQKNEMESAIASLIREIKEAEKSYSANKGNSSIVSELDELEEKQKNLNRELGRVEGALTAEKHNTEGTISPAIFIRELKETISLVDTLMHRDSFEALKSGLKDVKVQLEGLQKICQGGSTNSEKSPLSDKKTTLARELYEIEKTLRALQEQKNEELASREDILSDLREREHKIRGYEHELEALREQIRELDFNDEKLKERRALLKDMQFEGRRADGKRFTDDKERHSLFRAIERLKIKLEEAGGIDRTVLKEFDDTKKRDEFLDGELADLKKAVNSLEVLMRELDTTLEIKFEEGLTKINERFFEYFKRMFGGGKASLNILKSSRKDSEDSEDEGGLDVSIDVPKKRLRSLDMLSGGERALTSVALLFAMSAVNPPPFLVLDETDAALDEANSGRYGELLDELSKKLQLVVITHNRQTMGHAGALYGVTMGGDGISKILSLRFEEAKEYASEAT
jgi:chromosome segregation ATPase